MKYFFQILVMGITATVMIDVWLAVLNKVFNLPTTNWAMVGRWFAHLPSGKFIHRPIGSSAEIKHERALGWVIHYVIGIVYAYLYLAVVFYAVASEPTVLSAVLFGLATVLVPWLVLQPGMGLGILARKTPNPNVIRLISLSVHSIFGVSLYLGWIVSTLLTK